MTFEDWWGDDPKHGVITAREAWRAARKAERERIKKIVDEVGRQGNHNEWFDCCDTIMKRISE